MCFAAQIAEAEGTLASPRPLFRGALAQRAIAMNPGCVYDRAYAGFSNFQFAEYPVLDRESLVGAGFPLHLVDVH